MTGISSVVTDIKAFALSRALMTALELDLFRTIATSPPSSLEGWSQSLGLNWAVARPFFLILVAHHYLSLEEGHLKLGSNAAPILENRDNLRAWNEEMLLTFASLATLTQAMRAVDADTPLKQYWAYRQQDQQRDPGSTVTSAYSHVMDHSVEDIAQALCHAFDFSSVRTLADFGGGYGRLALTVARTSPGVSITIVDLPSVCAQAEAIIQRSEFASRINCLGADLLGDPPSLQVEAVSFSRVLHDWDDLSALALLRQAYRSLVPGGSVLICEPLLPESAAQPDPGPLVYGLMQALLGGKRRLRAEYQSMLESVGFENVSVVPLGAHSTMLVSATKP